MVGPRSSGSDSPEFGLVQLHCNVAHTLPLFCLLRQAFQLCPPSWTIPKLDEASIERHLSKDLRPLRPHEVLDVPRLSRLLCRVCAAQSDGKADHHFCLAGASGGFKHFLSVPGLLGSLACAEAASRARKEVHELAVDAVRTGIFLERPLQLHHLALLEWAGADWKQPDSWGRSSLHGLCAGTSLRSFAGGGGDSAPLRSAGQGARARYLARRSRGWETTEDRHGLTALNYLLPPLQPFCACAGSAQWEIFQSLAGCFVNSVELVEVVSPMASWQQGSRRTFVFFLVCMCIV